ncbi:MAG: ABC transporter ATP-binding protein [Thermoproteota archaeon]|nr:MAG: ABC transporter ATP-binding protein [Candidatus Korarchaeota archaeon]
MADLELVAVSKRFGRVRALRDVTLSVGDGEYLCLLGPTGAGKTTLLNVVAGVVRPDSGRVLIGGRDVTDLPPEERGVGYMPQGYALFPHMTAWENVTFGPEVRGWPRGDVVRVGRQMLESVGLLERADALPKELSGGMQQRVALARALASSPNVLLLDEPLRALDALLRLRLRYEVREMAKALGMTTVHVTHDYEEALSVADRVALLRSGELVEVGTPVDLYERPKTLFTAYFVGEGTLALGTAEPDGEWTRVRIGDLELRSSRPASGEVVVVVRSRLVRISPDGAGHGTVEARVLEARFLGRFTRFRLLAGGVELLADVPSTLVPRISEGGEVSISIRPEHVLLFDVRELERFPEVREVVAGA